MPALSLVKKLKENGNVPIGTIIPFAGNDNISSGFLSDCIHRCVWNGSDIACIIPITKGHIAKFRYGGLSKIYYAYFFYAQNEI